MIKNILVIGHSNIGDVCYDLAVIDPLRMSFPQAKISFLTSSRAENIAKDYKGLDKIFILDKGAKGSISRRLCLTGVLMKERFDLAIALKRTLMPYFLGIPRVWKVRKDLKFKQLRHVVDSYLELLQGHGLEAKETAFDFGLGKEEDKFCDDFFLSKNISPDDRFVGIFPLAAWSLKNWPIDRWNELAEVLSTQYKIKVIAFGKNNGDPYNQMVVNNISKKIIFAQTPTLKQAMALIKRCSLFIGPDSSLLHLASCMGVEVVALYGPTSPEYIYPYFHKHNIILAKEKMDCMPCSPSTNFCLCQKEYRAGDCMENIHLDNVLGSIREKLNL